jgi:hypothetical protein
MEGSRLHRPMAIEPSSPTEVYNLPCAPPQYSQTYPLHTDQRSRAGLTVSFADQQVDLNESVSILTPSFEELSLDQTDVPLQILCAEGKQSFALKHRLKQQH